MNEEQHQSTKGGKSMSLNNTGNFSQNQSEEQNKNILSNLPLSHYLLCLIAQSEELYRNTLRDTLSLYYSPNTIRKTISRLRQKNLIIFHKDHSIYSYTLSQEGKNKLKKIDGVLATYCENQHYRLAKRNKNKGTAEVLIALNYCGVKTLPKIKPQLSQIKTLSPEEHLYFYTKKEILNSYTGTSMIQIKRSIFKGLLFIRKQPYIVYSICDKSIPMRANEIKMFQTLSKMVEQGFWGKHINSPRLLVFYENSKLFTEWTFEKDKKEICANNFRQYLNDVVFYSKDIFQALVPTNDNLKIDKNLELLKLIIQNKELEDYLYYTYLNQTKPVSNTDTKKHVLCADRDLNGHPFYINITGATHTILKAISSIKKYSRTKEVNKMSIGILEHQYSLISELINRKDFNKKTSIYTISLQTALDMMKDLTTKEDAQN